MCGQDLVIRDNAIRGMLGHGSVKAERYLIALICRRMQSTMSSFSTRGFSVKSQYCAKYRRVTQRAVELSHVRFHVASDEKATDPPRVTAGEHEPDGILVRHRVGKRFPFSERRVRRATEPKFFSDKSIGRSVSER